MHFHTLTSYVPSPTPSDSISTYLNESMELVKDVDTILTTIKVQGGVGDVTEDPG